MMPDDHTSEAHMAVVRAFFPSSVAVFAAGPGDYQSLLYPEEVDIVRRAVRARREDFAAARFCARRALAELGAPVGPILKGPDGSPVWPRGYVGSISHCTGLRVAVAARCGDVPGLGVDVEGVDPLTPDVARLICRADEFHAFALLPPLAAGNWAKLAFSAKESVYKCHYPQARRFLDFHDVAVTFADFDEDRHGGGFHAEVIGDVPRSTHFIGRWRILAGRIHTGAMSA